MTAVAAMLAWNPEVEREPFGWFRNQQPGKISRRRPGGDPTLEYEWD